MDIILDLWTSAVYNDNRVQGSFLGPVAYFRNGSGCPLISYAELAQRWGVSKATVGRILKKLSNRGYLALMTFPGRHGTAIYLQNYLSTMFQISDVLVDKDEVALSLNIKLSSPNGPESSEQSTCESVSNNSAIVSKQHHEILAAKVLKILDLQGIPCCRCPQISYQLYPLSDVGKGSAIDGAGNTETSHFRLELSCGRKDLAYSFVFSITPVHDSQSKGGSDNDKKGS